MPLSTSGVCATPDDADSSGPHTSTPTPPIQHPSGLPACLRLPEDILLLILNEVVTPTFCEPTGAAAAVAHSPVADLKRLAVVHSIFLGPVRTHLYGTPNLEGSLGDLKDPCACASCQVGRSAHWEHSPLRKLSEALTLNPALGSFIRHLDRLGDLTQSLSHFNISPSLVSRTILGVLQRAPNVLSLDMPLVELRNQGDLVEAVTQMQHLRRLRLSSGCVMTKDGTSMMHEGDLRRIARACVGLEELEILTEHLGCGSSDGWVEPFPFTELREVRLARATSVTDRHLLAMLSPAKHLHSLTIIKSAGLDGTSGIPVLGTTKRTHALTTTGIAAILERRGATLKHLHIDVSDQEIDTEATSGTIPSIQAALVKCPRLRTLALSGPGLVLPTSLPYLGSPAPSTPSRSFGMPFPGPGGPATVDLPGLSNLERLSIGLYPPLYRPILDFLRSLPPSPTSPFATLKSIIITNPPANCTGHDPDATANVSALQAAVADTSIALHFTTPSFDWDTAHAWARPGGLAQRNPGAGFQLLGGGPAWAQGPLGWAAGAPQAGFLARRLNGVGRAVTGVPGAPPANFGPFVRTRRIGQAHVRLLLLSFLNLSTDRLRSYSTTTHRQSQPYPRPSPRVFSPPPSHPPQRQRPTTPRHQTMKETMETDSSRETTSPPLQPRAKTSSSSSAARPAPSRPALARSCVRQPCRRATIFFRLMTARTARGWSSTPSERGRVHECLWSWAKPV